MQPEYEKPVIKRPDFTEAEQPCYDYRNMESAGKFRGVGQAGKTGFFEDKSLSCETMPRDPRKRKLRRDHEG